MVGGGVSRYRDAVLRDRRPRRSLRVTLIPSGPPNSSVKAGLAASLRANVSTLIRGGQSGDLRTVPVVFMSPDDMDLPLS